MIWPLFDKWICRVSNLFCYWFKVLYRLESAVVVSWRFVCSFMCFHNRNTMFVRVLAVTRITLLVDSWLGCQIFRRRSLLRINGLSIKKGYKDANLLMPCGYWVHPYYCVLFAYFYPFICSIRNWTSLNYNDCIVILWWHPGSAWSSLAFCCVEVETL